MIRSDHMGPEWKLTLLRSYSHRYCMQCVFTVRNENTMKLLSPSFNHLCKSTDNSHCTLASTIKVEINNRPKSNYKQVRQSQRPASCLVHGLVRSLANKTFIDNDIITAHKLDFIQLTEAWQITLVIRTLLKHHLITTGLNIALGQTGEVERWLVYIKIYFTVKLGSFAVTPVLST